MNLKLSVPKGVDIDSVSFSLPFDIDKRLKTQTGILLPQRTGSRYIMTIKRYGSYRIGYKQDNGRTAYRLFDAVRKGYARQGYMRLSVFAEVLYALCGACKDI